jgi:hypothetical protein
MQQAKQPFGTRLQLIARLTLNVGKYTADQERQAVEFWVETGDYRGVVRVPRRVFQRF